MTDKLVRDLRYAYVELLDAADEMRECFDTEFALGVANGYDMAADVIRAILDSNVRAL